MKGVKYNKNIEIFVSFAIIFLVIAGVYIGIYYVNSVYKNEVSFKETAFKSVGYALNPNDHSNVQRGFSNAFPSGGNVITVTLSVTIDPSFDHDVYIIEEHVPNGLNIVDAGDATQSGNTLKWARVSSSGVYSTTHTYQVRVPYQRNNFSFNGFYGIDGMDSPSSIGGEYLVSVAGSSCTPNWVNTSWSPWFNVSCLANNSMLQESKMRMYDSNHCFGTNETIYKRHRAVEFCDFSTWKPHIFHKKNYFDYSYTTNFSLLAKEDLQRLFFAKFKRLGKKTRLMILDRLNISRDLNLTGNFIIEDKWIYINSNELPEFKKRAKLMFYDVDYLSPVIYKDGEECSLSDCTNISFNFTAQTYSFVVSSFSNYSIHESAYCGDGTCSSDIGESCHTCSQDCGSCSGGGSGGGGGGGSSGSSSGGSTGIGSSSGGTYSPTSGSQQSSYYNPSVQGGESGQQGQNNGQSQKSDEFRRKAQLILTASIIFILGGIAIVVLFIIKYFKESSSVKPKENIILKKIKEGNLKY